MRIFFNEMFTALLTFQCFSLSLCKMFNVYKDFFLIKTCQDPSFRRQLRIIQLHYEYLEHYIPSNTTHLKVKDF